MFTLKEPQLKISLPSHALVIGGSIAGLLAARVLLNHFERVTIVERDRFPDQSVIAAMAAVTLDECLKQQFQRQHNNLTGLTRRFQQRLAKLNATPWMMATGEDFRWPTTVGEQPNRTNQIMQRYIDTLQQLMLVHPSIYRAFLEVMHMVKPPSVLFHPNIVARVLWSTISKQQNISSTSFSNALN